MDKRKRNISQWYALGIAALLMAGCMLLAVGSTLAIEAVVLPVSVSTVDQTLIWTSSDETVATVDENGVVTGVSAGVVQITATDAKGNSDTITITVTGSLGSNRIPCWLSVR